MKNFGKILWGIDFILLGILLGVKALGLTDINIFFKGWWTLFIIIPCFIGIFTEKEKTGNIIGIIIGVALLLCARGIINFSAIFKLLIPIILIVIGIGFIFKEFFSKKISEKISELNKNVDEEHYATFSSQDINYNGEEFKGTKVNAIFGGANLDLRNAKIKGDQVINCTAIFGGIDILVPDNMKVKVKSTSIFGGVSDEKKQTNEDSKHTLYINATCIFGGVEIK